jgi:hypothetical protein
LPSQRNEAQVYNVDQRRMTRIALNVASDRETMRDNVAAFIQARVNT